MVDYLNLQHPALGRFAAVASRYCKLVEELASFDRESFLSAVHLLLPRLYLAGLELPPTDVLFNDGAASIARDDAASEAVAVTSQGSQPDPDRQTYEEWAALATQLGELLADRGGYREVFDPYAPDSDEEVIGSLADDIADIYGDLSRGLRKWRRGESGQALWEWRFNFEHHWGEHLTGALRAIFALSAWHNLGWPSSEPVETA